LPKIRWYTYSERLRNEEVPKQIATARIGGIRKNKDATGKMD
jgi:hypothetical protein